MTPKKPDGKKATRSRPSLVSTSLEGLLRGTADAPAPVEPWRNRKSKGKSKTGRKK